MWAELWILLVTLYVTWYILISSRKSTSRLPPGPWGIPILGHLPLLGANPHQQLLKWKKVYGPLIFVRFGSFPTIVLNDVKLIREAFSLPAFAGRSQIKPLIEGTEGKGIIMSEGPDNTEQRQFVLRSLRDFGFGRKTIELNIREEIEEFIKHLKPMSGQVTQVKHLFTTFIVNSLWSIIIGERFDSDGKANHVHKFASQVSRAGDARFLLEKLSMFLPWMGVWMGDLCGYNAKVTGLREITAYMRKRIDQRKSTWVKGQPRDFTDAYLDKVDETTDVHSSFHEKNNYQPQATSDMFMASMETTSNSLEWLCYYFSRNPTVQTKLQEEVDKVVGQIRLPNLSDRGQMPFAEAIVQELLRITSIVPLAVFHQTLVDIEDFHGYTIPKGTTVMSNVYAVQHDPVVWGDPENFRPDRFIGEEDGKLKKSENMMAFGYGKRSCIGEGLARDQLFLYTASLAQKFTVSAPPGSGPIEPVFGVTLGPPQFEAIFTERKGI